MFSFPLNMLIDCYNSQSISLVSVQVSQNVFSFGTSPKPKYEEFAFIKRGKPHPQGVALHRSVLGV